MKRLIAATILLMCLTGCGFAIEDKITGNYYLQAVDTQDELVVGYRNADETSYTVLIDQTVFAVGFNDQYLIAKQHPSEFGKTIDKKTTNYFVLPINIKEGGFVLPIEPLTKAQFEKKRNELGIEKIAFTKVYKELE